MLRIIPGTDHLLAQRIINTTSLTPGGWVLGHPWNQRFTRLLTKLSFLAIRLYTHNRLCIAYSEWKGESFVTSTVQFAAPLIIVKCHAREVIARVHANVAYFVTWRMLWPRPNLSFYLHVYGNFIQLSDDDYYKSWVWTYNIDHILFCSVLALFSQLAVRTSSTSTHNMSI